MAWLAALDGHDFDLETLQAFSDERVKVIRREDGWFLGGADIEDATDAYEAQDSARKHLQFLNGMGRATTANFKPVALTHSVMNDASPQSRSVFAEVHMTARSRLTIGSPAPQSRSGWHEDPVLNEVALIMGRSERLEWFDLWKVWEVLRSGAGGEEQFRSRLGFGKREVARFKHSANHSQVSGELARHAVSEGEPPKDPMALDEGRDWIREAARRWRDVNP